MTRTMPLDETAYSELEQRFRDQVIEDRSHFTQWVEKQGLSVYLPSVKPNDMANYIFVGMEPSRAWANSVEDAERKVAEGCTNYEASTPSWDAKHPLNLMKLSINRFLLQCGETYYLTDVSKGAMLVEAAGIDRQQRYMRWYPLLLEEIDIVGKQGAPIIAIGKTVEDFLKRMDFEKDTGRSLYRVMHYSRRASRHWKTEAERDKGGFKTFKQEEFGKRKRWANDLSPASKQLVFTYRQQFNRIMGQDDGWHSRNAGRAPLRG